MHRASCRLTADEYAIVVRAAGEAGEDVAGFVRRRVMAADTMPALLTWAMAARTMLAEIQWSGAMGVDQHPACPVCDAREMAGRHKPGCRLAAMLDAPSLVPEDPDEAMTLPHEGYPCVHCGYDSSWTHEEPTECPARLRQALDATRFALLLARDGCALALPHLRRTAPLLVPQVYEGLVAAERALGVYERPEEAPPVHSPVVPE